MGNTVTEHCEFETDRLRVGPWHAMAPPEVDLGEALAPMLTESTTAELPPSWHGHYTADRASAWIDERDRESPTLLVVDRASGRPVGLVILFEVPLDAATLDVRIGYLLDEGSWGRGLATELVAGLVDWARAQASVLTLTGGVASTNRASARVLTKNGFAPVVHGETGEAIYRLTIEHGNAWEDYADGWDRDEAARAYAAAAFDSLQAALDERALTLAGARVIDFGCGTGLLTERLASHDAEVDAVDTSTAMLDVLRAKIDRHGWPNVVASTELPSDEDGYHLIVCSSVCSFLADYQGTVQRLASLLRPGGLFIQWDWERNDDDPEPHGLTRGEIGDALAAAGLDELSVGTGFVASAGGYTMRPLMGHGRRPLIGS